MMHSPDDSRTSREDMPSVHDLSATTRASQSVVTDTELRTLVDRLSLDDKARITAGHDIATTEDVPTIALRRIKMVDGPMGVTSGRIDERDVSLLSPCGTAL